MFRKLLACVTLTLSVTQCFATDPYGYSSESEGNMKFTIGINVAGVDSAGDKVSGTKVEMDMVCYAVMPGGGGGGPTFQDYEVMPESQSLTINETPLSPLPDVGSVGDGYAAAVRFSSTHFAHNSDIEIIASAMIRGVFKDGSGNVTGYGSWHDLTVTVTPKAYNVGKAWATKVNGLGTDMGDPPAAWSGPSEARIGTGYFYSRLPNSNHQQPSADNDKF